MFSWLKKILSTSSATSNSATKKADFYAEHIEFNTKWVSLDYGGSTAKRIKALSSGDPIKLQWSNSSFRDGEHIKVLTADGNQIGWVPYYEEDFKGLALENAVKNHWPVDAKVKLTGKVNDPDKNIWWCVVVVDFKVKYTSTGDEVYMALNNNRYHSDPNCGSAQKRRVPLFVAEQYGRIPCPKCYVLDQK